MLPLIVAAFLQLFSFGLGEGSGRVVCYYAGWAGQRRPPYAVFPSDLPPDLCTHIIFSAAVPSLETGIAPADPPQLTLNGYREAVGLKAHSKKGLRVLLSLEAIEDGARTLSQLVEDTQVRNVLARGTVTLLRALKMDGLDINWQFPGLRSNQDSEHLISFLKVLREEMDNEARVSGKDPLLLTMSVPPIEGLVRLGFPLRSLNKYVDWFNVLAMDYHTSNEKETAHPSPLYPLPGDAANAHLNVDTTIRLYHGEGVDKSKLVVGIPLYGRTYLLQSAFQNRLGAPALTRSTRRQHIKETLALYELCRFVEKGGGWTTERPNATAMGPYSYYADVWVAYDDIDMVIKKAEYVKNHGLGGLAFWTVDQDDVLGECGPRYATVAAAAAALSSRESNNTHSASSAASFVVTEPPWQENSVSPPGEAAVDPILVGQGVRPGISDLDSLPVHPPKEETPPTFGSSPASSILPPFTPDPDDLPVPESTPGYNPDALWGPRKNISEEQHSTTLPPAIQTDSYSYLPNGHVYSGYAPNAPSIPFIFEPAPEVVSQASVTDKPIEGNVPYNENHLWGPRENISNTEDSHLNGNIPYKPDHLWGPRENISKVDITPAQGNIPYTPDHLWGPRENISLEAEPSPGDIPYKPDHLWGPRENISVETTEQTENFLAASSPSASFSTVTEGSSNRQSESTEALDKNISNEVASEYGNRPFVPDHLWGPRENISESENNQGSHSFSAYPSQVPSGPNGSLQKPHRGNTIYSGTRKPSRTGERAAAMDSQEEGPTRNEESSLPNIIHSSESAGTFSNDEPNNPNIENPAQSDYDTFVLRDPEYPEKNPVGPGANEPPVEDNSKWISALNKALSQIPVTLNGTLRHPGDGKSDFSISSLLQPVANTHFQYDEEVPEDAWDAKVEASNSERVPIRGSDIPEKFPDEDASPFPYLNRVVLNNTRDVFLQTVRIYVTNHFYQNGTDGASKN